MQGRLHDGAEGPEIRVGDDARQRFHDASGYGHPLDGSAVALAPVEAAHLLFRGDLDAIADGDEQLGLRDLLARFGVIREFMVYRDLRDRGIYCSPARSSWVPDGVGVDGVDIVVYPRGSGPGDGEVERLLRIHGEREPVPLAPFVTADAPDLTVVDEDGEPTYLDTAPASATGDSDPWSLPSGVPATPLADRVLAWDPPTPLYDDAFFGQRLAGRTADSGPLQLSLVEAAYLAERGALTVGPERVAERGRAVEGERFDRRRRVYAALRDAGAVPKSGFKFGADFRVYDEFSTVAALDHSTRLIRVHPSDAAPLPRDLSRDVRLAAGVRKRTVYALTGGDGITWLSIERMTP